MVERGNIKKEDNRKFSEKAFKIFGKSRRNPFVDRRFGRNWTEKHNIVVRTFGYNALRRWEEDLYGLRKEIVENLNASENQLPVNNGELILEGIDYYLEGDDTLLFLETKSEKRDKKFYILISNKKGAEEAYIIDRRERGNNARINYYPDGVRLKSPEYRTAYIREGFSPTEGASSYWLNLTNDLKTIGREDILPPVVESWSNYELGI